MGNSRKLDYAERWLRDGLEVSRPTAFFQVLDVDMTQAQRLIRLAKSTGLHITYTHLMVRAAALALAANPDLHRTVCGGRVHTPEHVDIALSIAGDMFVSPTLVIESADQKLLPVISQEVEQRAGAVRDCDRKMMQVLRRWGWILPFSALRRALLRALFRNESFRRKGSGTFQVSVLKHVDYSIAPMFNACGILTAGRVHDAVLAVDGKPAVRPVVTLTCSGDHRIWDGRAGERFLAAVRDALQGAALMADLQGCAVQDTEPYCVAQRSYARQTS